MIIFSYVSDYRFYSKRIVVVFWTDEIKKTSNPNEEVTGKKIFRFIKDYLKLYFENII